MKTFIFSAMWSEPARPSVPLPADSVPVTRRYLALQQFGSGAGPGLEIEHFRQHTRALVPRKPAGFLFYGHKWGRGLQTLHPELVPPDLLFNLVWLLLLGPLEAIRETEDAWVVVVVLGHRICRIGLS